MHPVIIAEITAARIADRHRQAERRALARAARQAHNGPAPQWLTLATTLARVLTLLAAGGRAVQVRSRALTGGPPAGSCASCT